MQFGIISVGAYIPRLRLSRSSIAAAHKWMSPSLAQAAKGFRSFCSYDEDAVTMAVEAVRDCLPPDQRSAIEAVCLASTTLPFADMSNAAIVAGAADINPMARCSESTGSQRAASLALRSALKNGQEECLIIASERPQAKPASVLEMQLGAGAAAVRVGNGEPVATYCGSSGVTATFPDHVRAVGSDDPYFWEERWIRDEGFKIIPGVVKSALENAGVGIGDIAHLAMSSNLRGAGSLIARAIGFKGAVVDDLQADCGYTGAAHPLMMLASVLEKAKAGERILVVTFGQGADAIILQATGKESGAQRGVQGSLADRIETHDYLRFLSFYDRIDLDWGMRAETQEKAALSNAWRSSSQLLGFRAGRCPACGTVQFPQLPVCVSQGCGTARKEFTEIPLADEPAKVLTYTADWLSYHPAPPLFTGFVQFTNGARLSMETCDATADIMDVGLPLRMVFRNRKTDPRNGYRRYFWKATPVSV